MTVTDIETDFCIVGGGPAGMVLALLLARSGARVALIERSRSFDREFRGEILQPGALALLDQIGVLNAVRERGGHDHYRFQLVDRGKTLINADYRKLPAPYNYLLSVPQRHVLEELLGRCQRYSEFVYVEGSKVTGLVREGDRVCGVTTDGRAGALSVRAHCVIGADGRYSKVRRLAGIADGRVEAFDQDVLWFKLPIVGEPPRDVRIFRAAGNPVLAYVSIPESIQLGWTLPHQRYREIAERGIDYITDEVAKAIPPYAALVKERITSLKDLTLLDVFSGCAEWWVQEGLVLIGDSAHTHSPIGAQGIMLAIQDAVALHPVLMRSLREKDPGVAVLDTFATPRRRDIDAVMRLQKVQSKMMLSTSGPAAFIRPRMAGLVSRTPIYTKILHKIAYGNRGIRVADDLFVDRDATLERG